MGYIPPNARWYLADIVLEHIIDGDPRNVVHTNMILVEADSPQRAYEKAMELGGESEMVYANTDGREVRVIFRGLRALDVIHEDLENGAEIGFKEDVAVPEEKLQSWLIAKEKLNVFVESERPRDIPNYFPESVAKMLEDDGFTRPEFLKSTDTPNDNCQ